MMHVLSLYLHEDIAVIFWCETHGNKLAAFEHRALHECRVFEHGCERLAHGHVGAIDLRQFSPGKAASIEKSLPVNAAGPPFQRLGIESVATQVVKLKVVRFLRQPFPGLATGVAAFYSI